MLLTKMTNAELEILIIDNDDLYNMFDECRLLDNGYSREEMIEIITKWVEANDECAGC